jgi:predicted HAD superfamily Cof-like phosphohydrolase
MKVPFVDEVEQFNNMMGKPNNYTPLIPEEKEWKFVYDFILEELNEYKEACENGDIVGVADALGDIMYVLSNGIMLHGMKDKIIQVYQEIQSSNMSKACKTEEEAIETSLYRSKELGIETYYEKTNDYWVVYRKSDKKVLKSLSYFPPNLEQFFTDDEINAC